MSKYAIFADSCCDLDTKIRKEHDIKYVQMGIVVDGKEYPADLDWKAYGVKEFYDWMRQGKKIKTTQVSVNEYEEKFSEVLEKGEDVLYIACSSALSGSINLANSIVKEALLEKYPGRKIICIDSLAASVTQGMLVLAAADMRDEGKSIDEVAKWVEENKLKANQFATVSTLTYLKNAGRIKGTSAFFGNIVGVKPIFISDRKGNNFVVGKVRGTKNSLTALVDGVKNAIVGDPKDAVAYVGHGDDVEGAEILKERLLKEVGVKDVIVQVIGPIVGTTCGPGILGTFVYGKEVTVAEGDPVKE